MNQKLHSTTQIQIEKEKTMNKQFKVLTILGSPHDGKSNTRALVEDFIDDVSAAGLPVEHQVISLGRKKVLPCKGCWACTRNKPCPLSKLDDLEHIKKAMLECDMLILASPVYCNQITAQMKALIDRLFTWCHIFPLLGKYSLSAVTTGGDGIPQTGDYLEKILATYGTYSFGTIQSMGGLTPGFFPARAMARAKNRRLAQRVAQTVLAGKQLPVRRIQRQMYKVMKRKMMGIHAVNCIYSGLDDGQPKPPWMLSKLIKGFMEKTGVTSEQLKKWAGLLSFELEWWKCHGWLHTKSFQNLSKRSVPSEFNHRTRLLKNNSMTLNRETAA
jgi:multimeric flavodoxin WrbA